FSTSSSQFEVGSSSRPASSSLPPSTSRPGSSSTLPSTSCPASSSRSTSQCLWKGKAIQRTSSHADQSVDVSDQGQYHVLFKSHS
ncbi:hypothetical protein LINPERHAP1_LOCUS36733, partial [Linum perenne]